MIFLLYLYAGFFVSNGEIWRENRRFILHQLHNLGFGKLSLEEPIMMEIKLLIEYFEKFDLSQPIELDWGLNVAGLNNVSKLMTGNERCYLLNNILRLILDPQ